MHLLCAGAEDYVTLLLIWFLTLCDIIISKMNYQIAKTVTAIFSPKSVSSSAHSSQITKSISHQPNLLLLMKIHELLFDYWIIPSFICCCGGSAAGLLASGGSDDAAGSAPPLL